LAQFTEILHESHVLKFFIVHLSSLYGAVIFCFLINELRLKRILFACPVFIEIFQSWVSSGCFDFPDILFSIIGILFAQTLLFYENRKKQLMN